MRVVRTFESTVEHLEFHHLNIKNNDEDIKLNLRKLKSVSISLCSTKLCTAVLKDRQSIQSLNIGHFSPSEDLETIAETVKNLKNVTDLVASPKWFSILFGDYTKKMECKLKKFIMGSDMYFNDQESFEIFKTTQLNFFEFLRTQTDSLESLKLAGFFCANIVKVAFGMKHLETFVVPFLRMISVPVIDFPVNRSIKNLDIACIDRRNKEFIRIMFYCAPNVETLRIQKVNRNMAVVMKIILERLKKVTTAHENNHRVSSIIPYIQWN
jgi:hypothetical protein